MAYDIGIDKLVIAQSHYTCAHCTVYSCLITRGILFFRTEDERFSDIEGDVPPFVVYVRVLWVRCKQRGKKTQWGRRDSVWRRRSRRKDEGNNALNLKGGKAQRNSLWSLTSFILSCRPFIYWSNCSCGFGFRVIIANPVPFSEKFLIVADHYPRYQKQCYCPIYLGGIIGPCVCTSALCY